MPPFAADCHDSAERTWRHLNLFEHKTFLHAHQPRIECPEHGVKTAAVPWGRSGSGFTLLMEAFILVRVQGGMTAAQAARLIDEHHTRLWRVLQHYVEQARAAADFSTVKIVGMDETSRRRGHNYVTVFAEPGAEQTRVLFVTEGKDADTVAAFKKDLEAHGGQAVQLEEACLDMSAAFIRGLKGEFPKAQVTFDNFHRMQLLGQAVDQVRRAVDQVRRTVDQVRREEPRMHPELKGTR